MVKRTVFAKCELNCALTTYCLLQQQVPELMHHPFKRAGIIGVGLIGGSFAAALRQHALVDHLIGLDRHQTTLDEALRLGLINEGAINPAALAHCDLIFLAVPVAQTEEVLRSLLPYLSPTVIITDAGSTKQDVIDAARRALGERFSQFVPGHPIAGKETNGPAAAQATLYRQKNVILTPAQETSPAAVARVQALWSTIGARVAIMSAVQHDAVFAAVSHLPHLLAYALVSQIANAQDASVKLGFAGAGFKDFTRIAASSPQMWTDVFLANKTALLEQLSTYQAVLAQAKIMLQTNDRALLERWLTRAADTRQNWPLPAQPSDPVVLPLPDQAESS